MSKTTITINDIARELDVAPSTVSRALNNSSKISEKTKKLIHEKAAELGYDLNLVASSLSRNKTNIIGVVVPNISSYFYSQAVSGIEAMAYDAGYRLIMAQTNESFEREQEIISMFSATRVDGIIASLSMETRDVPHLQKLKKNHIPFILFDRVSYSVDCYRVVVDDYSGAFQATSHLIKTGCKHPAYLGGPLDCKVFKEQARGFEDALKKHDIDLLPQFSLSTDFSQKDVLDATRHWLNQFLRPDGIVITDSGAALQVARYITGLGIRIPEDIAIVAIGYEPALEYVSPAISSVEKPGFEIGRSAISHLLDEIEGRSMDHQTVIKPIQMVIRSSSFR